MILITKRGYWNITYIGRNYLIHLFDQTQQLYITFSGILVPTKSMAQGDYPAFFASMSKDEHTVGPHHTLIFDSVKTNILNGYNNNSGVFQVPQTGTYAFSYAISNIGGSLCIELVRNAAAVDALYTDASNSQDMTGKIYIGYFDANDIVFVRIHSSRAGAGYISSDSCGYSSFAGYRIM